MQDSIIVGEGEIEGTSISVVDYQIFPAGEQTGNFLALLVTATSGATITAELEGSQVDPVDLGDGYIVFKLYDVATEKVKITASKSGLESVVKEYSLANMFLV